MGFERSNSCRFEFERTREDIEQLFCRNWHELVRLAQKSARPGMAEDAVHQALLNVRRSFEKKERRSIRYPWSYICRAVLNAVKDDRTQRSRRIQECELNELQAAVYTQEVDSIIVSAGVRSFLDELHPLSREVFLRCGVQGDRYQDVSLELGITLCALKARLYQARKVLRHQYPLNS